MRSYCLILQVPMIMTKCLQTYYIIAIALKFFYGAQNYQRSVKKHYFFALFELLKEAFVFWRWISDFGPNSLRNDLSIAWSRELVRLKAYNLKLLSSTYLMVARPIEKFLLALEVGWVRFAGSQKVLKIMDFECLKRSMGNSGVQTLVKS